MLLDAQKKCIFFHKLTIFWSARNRRKDSFYFHILHHLSPVSLADATAVAFVLLHSCRFNFHVMHSMNQRLFRNRLRSGSCDLSQLLARKIMKGIHSCKPASLNCPTWPSLIVLGWPCAVDAALMQRWPFVTSCAKDYKGHSLMQTSFSELPSTTEFDHPWVTLCSWRGINAVLGCLCSQQQLAPGVDLRKLTSDDFVEFNTSLQVRWQPGL